MDRLDPRDTAALVTTTRVVSGKNEMFATLAGRIQALRTHGTRGRPAKWTKLLGAWSDSDLAAAILFHIVRARLWADSAGTDPLLSTIGTALGTDLAGAGPHPDPDLPLKVGCALLGVAVDQEIIVLVPDGTGGVHVALAPSTYRRVQRLLDGGAPHVLSRVSASPPTTIETRMRHDMRLDRAEVPLRVHEAANKVQGTAWRINRAVLEALDAPKSRIRKGAIADGQVILEAQELAKVERFYFPAFLDFRGRLYQRGGVLTYTGRGDYARGLLEFADGELVDAEGMKWLTWHLAQMWGHKEDWPKAADGKPYLVLGDGTAWLRKASSLVGRWQEAKHPAQFLAAALAVVDASQGRPVHLPVRVDATCSGLQHLALLTGDQELAQLVNLWGDYHGDRRAMNWLEIGSEDFYQAVADRTGFDRKEVKAVIVPMLYGAGEDTSGIDLAGVRKKRRSKHHLQDAQAIRAAASELAPRAFELLRWFSRVADAHSEADIPIRWTAPSGFEAIQDYRYVESNPTRRDRQVQIMVNGQRRSLVKRFYTSFLDKPQQAISLPSSIVHSLDAALLTELVAGSRIDRWAVAHDAFAVPPNRVWELLDVDNDRAMAQVYGPDRLAEWVAAWRAEGVAVDDPPGGERGPLPSEMLGGLRTLG
jgi:DNA-directed RNA polymerase